MAECEVFDREVVAEKEVFVVWGANGWFWFPPPSMNSWSMVAHFLLIYLSNNSILFILLLLLFNCLSVTVLCMWWP